MGRKPVLSLAGMFLAGVTLTGCECTDWCCGNKTEKTGPVSRPNPTWPAQPQYQAPATTGFNRTTTPSDQSVVKPDTSVQPARESTVVTPSAGVQTGFQGSSASPVVNQDIVPPLPPMPSPDRQPAAARNVDITPMNLPTGSRTSTPRVEPDPQPEPPPLPPLTAPAAPTLEPPSNADDPPAVPAPPTPVPPGKAGSSQSSSKYPQSIPELPPPAPGVPVMPGAGPGGN